MFADQYLTNKTDIFEPMQFSIRAATLEDLSSIQQIYNHEIINGFATWNDQAYDLAHYQRWFQQLQHQGYPLFVMEDISHNKIAGYADYSAFRPFSGYRATVEHSVYIHSDYAKQGLGQRLLEHLIQHAQQNGFHSMIGAIDHANFASIKLHEKLGFKQTGYMPQVGQKFGTWRDLVLMQLNFPED